MGLIKSPHSVLRATISLFPDLLLCTDEEINILYPTQHMVIVSYKEVESHFSIA